MKAGFATLSDMAAELERQNAVKADYVVDTREMTLLNGTELHMNGVVGEQNVLPLAHGQIAARLKIPKRYYDRLLVDHPTLLDSNVNTLFREAPERRMVRTLDGKARAFLSDRYRRRDNFELAMATLPVLKKIDGCEILSCNVTDTRMYIKALAPRITGEVKEGDIVQAGVTVENSEVGLGTLKVSPLLYRLVCLNGMVSEEATGFRHVGGRVEVDENLEVYSDATLRLDDQAFFAKVGDLVNAAVDETKFNAIVGALRNTTRTPEMKDPVKGIELLANRYALTDGERDGVLSHLVRESDLTLYSTIQAVTRFSQDVESYDRASDLEKVGGRLLQMTERDWTQITLAGA